MIILFLLSRLQIRLMSRLIKFCFTYLASDHTSPHSTYYPPLLNRDSFYFVCSNTPELPQNHFLGKFLFTTGKKEKKTLEA